MAPQESRKADGVASGEKEDPLLRRPIAPSFEPRWLPRKATRKLQELTAPHTQSFDFFVERGLAAGVGDIPHYFVDLGESGSTVEYWVESATVGYPARKEAATSQLEELYPRDCRERGLMYSGPMTATVGYRVDDGPVQTLGGVSLGDLPVMVLSSRCRLRGLSPRELVQLHEEDSEMGGYFIVNGIERCIRLLQVPRRNYPCAVNRPSFKKRGPQYSEKGVIMRCVRPDQSSISMTVQYLNTGAATMRISVRKNEYLLPAGLVLKALSGASDREIYERLLCGQRGNTFLAARAEALLRETSALGVATQDEALAYLGAHFRVSLPHLTSHASASDALVGRELMRRYIAVHVTDFGEKAGAIFLCLAKLYAFVEGRCAADNADAMSNLEILMPGHLISAFVKEKIDEALQNVRLALMKEVRADEGRGSVAAAGVLQQRWMRKVVERPLQSIGSKLSYMLATGNIISSTGLDLMQVSGYTIVAERLNFLRYLSHFRSVHRGQFFTTMKTTAVRKLLPDSWGFLCPVHTPDGTPCGLLNHMSAAAGCLAWPPSDPRAPPLPMPDGAPLRTASREASRRALEGRRQQLVEVLCALGMAPGGGPGAARVPWAGEHLPVVVDGRVVGSVMECDARGIVRELRRMKSSGDERVDPTMEVAHMPQRASGLGPFAGIFLALDCGRMVRPVLNLQSNAVELVGPLEQVYMEVACLPEEVFGGTTHRELDPTNMLSLIASLTPFSDFNQSPRNCYQCQMGKQTMGTPAHGMAHRTDNKMYKIQTPQAPIVQTRLHGEYQLDEYPQGTNAVVAVISYTGFDMEDAMILNKGSFDRGFAHASVYKTKVVDLAAEEDHSRGAGGSRPSLRFGNAAGEDGGLAHPGLEQDGLPSPGTWVEEGDPLYCVVDDVSGEVHASKHKETERACVETVRVLGDTSAARRKDRGGARRVSMTLRFPRNPIIGDKFSSRHGQKGVLSILWPQEDMPFSESGITPDVIINPHAFPSRMTIGMLIESMAGKSGALHGCYQDSTPFQFYEKDRAVDYFGEQLKAAGYSYYGSEPLYSGVSGQELQVNIFIGVVYYQRLRHMVSDKSQVRAKGMVNQLTRQPVQGRKRGGGIRFGEMERDALLSHGTSFLLHDRLMNCSDRHIAQVCAQCGSVLSPSAGRSSIVTAGQSEAAAARALAKGKWTCRTCGPEARCENVALPYVYRYLAAELASMGVRLSLGLSK